MLPLGNSGFGINTNIFETNIINLAAVIGIVISFVGSNLTQLLNDRQKTILSNLEEASQRAREAEEKRKKAISQFELAQTKAQEIRKEGIDRATKEIKRVVSQHELRLSSLEELKNETIVFYQQKAVKKAYIYIVSRIMNRVRERLNKGLNTSSHVNVNNFYVSKLTEYTPKSPLLSF
jgi:F-type H+-transporting ATPase subunit b